MADDNLTIRCHYRPASTSAEQCARVACEVLSGHFLWFFLAAGFLLAPL